MKEKLDKTLTGVIFGALLPIVGFLISFPIKTRGRGIGISEYVDMALHSSSNQQDILIFCMLPNMFLFYFTNFRWNMYEFTKGLVAMTLLLGLTLVIFTYN